MATDEEIVKKVVLLGSKNVPETGWAQYFLRNPTLIFEGIRVLEIVILDNNSDAPFSEETKQVIYIVHTFFIEACNIMACRLFKIISTL